ncbi:NUDIX domain-containing protein [Sphingomonas sp. S2-65]|uniref:NUDIX domain-containing protein n=1 Tax=Sphingomonas sp. S2-65 TaxID=2903960 RepID=UPI001F3A8FCA|nr:NUDIX domain-containing protein [Sphingomonas sp. S2-65]UYY59326.1 NUDIX domain-containing protein [Sphingomonas sp. S2-65]
MPKRSAGMLLYRWRGSGLELLLVHPGGPFWRNKDVGAWQIPKGQIEPEEDPASAALREVAEELGVVVTGTPAPLATIRQAGGKIVEAFLVEQDVDVDDPQHELRDGMAAEKRPARRLSRSGRGALAWFGRSRNGDPAEPTPIAGRGSAEIAGR